MPRLFAFLLTLTLASAQEKYPVDPASLPQDGVPHGKLSQHRFSDSKIFPGTQRDYWIYVPAQYDPAKPAAVMIFQDGAGYVKNDKTGGLIPIIFDNLIAAGEMPVTIGLFINPGIVPAPNTDAQPRFNRSYEYDGMGPDYANFLVEEMIPLLKSEHNLTISENPDDRGLCGGSSGAIAAFTAAWERPDQFRRVLSMIGTYVGLRGGNDYPTLIRQTEPKPLRVFLQDGKNDNNIYAGDWWMANQTMQRALDWAGYEHTHVWGEEAHNRNHGNAIMAEALRWLWKDHDTTPVTTHPENSKSRMNEFFIPGENWKIVSEGHNWAEGLAITADGTLYFTDVPDGEIFQVTPDGKETLFAKDSGKANGLALGPDGKSLYTASSGSKEIRRYNLADASFEVVSEGLSSNDLVVGHSGHLYFTDPGSRKVYHIDPKTGERSVATEQGNMNGIGMSADQTQLFVCDFEGPFIYSYSIGENGELKNKQPYFYARRPTTDKGCALDGMCAADNGHLLVGTETGLQIFDQPGRLQLCLPRPNPGDGRVNYAALHGDEIYIATQNRVYKRKTKLRPAPAWQPPVAPPKPHL